MTLGRSGTFAALASLAAFLMPRACLLCGQGCGDAPVCEACRAAIPGIDATRCSRCAQRATPALGSDGGPGGPGDVCAGCRSAPPTLDRVDVVADYASPLAEAITALKFGQQIALAVPMGHLLAERVFRPGTGGTDLCPPPDCLVPIPLSDARLAARGFNQAQLIAAALRSRWPLSKRPQILPDLLTRPQDRPHQSRLRRAERQANASGGFVASPAVQGRHVAIVDDVMTTGATLHAASTALREHGAASVVAFVFARTP